MANTYFHGSRETAKQLARRLVDILAGRADDSQRIARGVFLSIGFAALSSIKNDFLTKSRGGTGEDGVKWTPLSKEYLAYGRRFGDGEKKALKQAAGLPEGHRFGVGLNLSTLTKEQKATYRKLLQSHFSRLSVSMPLLMAKSEARKRAIASLRSQNVIINRHVSKLSVFGNRRVDILRDTGVLFNSLSPGQLDGVGPDATYTKPTEGGVGLQEFELKANGVIVGTNVPYAHFHQFGTSRMPARPFLPTGDVPDHWQQEWLDAGAAALTVGARQLFEAA